MNAHRSPVHSSWKIAVIFFFLKFASAHALNNEKTISQFTQSTWRTAEGLPELSIQTLEETNDGYLWVGTQEGLARFDGQHFTVFDHTNTPAFQSDFVTTLLEDDAHFLWVGTINGLLLRDSHGMFQSLAPEEPCKLSRVLSASRDRDGTIWIGGIGGLLHASSGHVLRCFRQSDGLANDVITSVVADGDGVIWTIARGHLHRISNGHVEDIATPIDSDDRPIHLYHDNHQAPILQTWKEQLLRWDGAHFQKWQPSGVSYTGRARAVLEDRDGGFWIATESSGLYRSRVQTDRPRAGEHELDDVGMQTLFQDKSGNLWVGTLGHGLVRLRDGVFTMFSRREGLAAQGATSVVTDSHGSVWVGTLNGLTRFDKNGAHQITLRQGLSNSFINALANAADGGIWVGMRGNIVDHIIDGRVDHHIDVESTLPMGAVTVVVEDNQHRLWIGTDGGGVFVWSNGSLKNYTTSDGLPSNLITTLSPGSHGMFWVGTSNGVATIAGDSVDRNPVLDGKLTDTTIVSLYEDIHGMIWIGTLSRGLVRVDGSEVTTFGAQQGLLDETVNCVLMDDDNNLWIGGNRGIVRIKSTSIVDVVNKAKQRLEISAFGEANGLKSGKTEDCTQSSATGAANGRLWFATMEGAAVVDPDNLGLAPFPLEPQIEQMFADNTLVNPILSEASLPSNLASLEIHYTAPDLTAAEAVEFRYRLTGTYDNWTNVGNERTARYVNVAPGLHRFEVQARRRNDMWSGSASIALSVPPLFYQTHWFFILALATVFLMLWITHYLRIESLRSRSAVADERRRIAGEIHDNLAQGFSAISIQIDAASRAIERSKELAIKHLTIAREVAISSLADARRSVWNLQSRRTTANSLAASIQSVGEQLTLGREIRLSTRIEGVPWIPNATVEHDMTRIAQEAVSNAIEHGKATEVDVLITYHRLHLELEVTDNGRGFEKEKPDRPHRGFGMVNMERRAHASGGHMLINSAQGVGTSVWIGIPRVKLLRIFEGPSAPKKRNAIDV